MNRFPPQAAASPRIQHAVPGLCCAIAVLAVALHLHAQPPASKPAVATKVSTAKAVSVKSFRLIQEKDGPAVEILSSQPLVPAIQAIPDPDRIVIDLPNAVFNSPPARVPVAADQITALRGSQFQEMPLIVRIVVDLAAPRPFTWDAAGNRLVVHLGKTAAPVSSPVQPASVPSMAPAPKSVVASVRSAGPLTFSTSEGNPGSAVSAGSETTIVRLSSGGQVDVCPGTTVAITPSQDRHNLMLSMNNGAMEAHLTLDASSDQVMTPDFRIQLAGPGEFHYAFSADPQGNTCVRALPGNTAPATVSEMMGDRTYQVKATDQLVFRGGQLDRVDRAVPLECGCPPAKDAAAQAPGNIARQEQTSRAPETGVAGSPASAGASSSDVHVEITAPFVFHPTGPPPAPAEDVRTAPQDARAQPKAEQPPSPVPARGAKPAGKETASAARPHSRGFFRRLGGFFASLFR